MSDLVPPSLAAKMQEWKRNSKKWTPHEYQERALKFMLEAPQSGLLLAPGLGKTSITLAATSLLLKKKLVNRALVIAPLRAIYDVWPAEISDWTDFNHLGIALLHGGNKDKTLRALKPEHKICLMNFEGIPWLMTDKTRMRELGADMLVVDEVSRLKSTTTQRFRRIRPHLTSFPRRHTLTGSPVPRHYEDLFGQVYILDRGATLGQYISHYRNQFFFPTGFEMREFALLPGSEKKINELVAPMLMRLDAKDYLKLPRVLERVHHVTLPPAARKEYDAVEDKMMGTLFTTPMVNSAAARSKCSQIANGSVYAEATPEDERWPSKERPVKVVHTAKVEALVDLYEELQGEPILVCIGFHHDVAAIRLAIGKDIPCINGAVSRTQSADYIERWNKGLLDMLMVHPASAGHALNLQKFNARHVAYYFIPDDYEHYEQSFARVWRQGNKSEFVMRHLFIADKTVDVPKLRNLNRKGSTQSDFLKAMREYDEQRKLERSGKGKRK